MGTLEGHRRIGHGGGINGFITQLAYYPDDEVTVAVLGNMGQAPSDRVAGLIARVVLGIGLPVIQDVATTAEERSRVVGSYQLGPGAISIRDEGGKLMFDGPGAPQRLKSQGDGRYIPENQTDWVLRFSPATGPVTEVVVNLGDTVMRGAKKP
jgi:hypothetical protein